MERMGRSDIPLHMSPQGVIEAIRETRAARPVVTGDLAAQLLSVSADLRPTMREVEAELEQFLDSSSGLSGSNDSTPPPWALKLPGRALAAGLSFPRTDSERGDAVVGGLTPQAVGTDPRFGSLTPPVGPMRRLRGIDVSSPKAAMSTCGQRPPCSVREPSSSPRRSCLSPLRGGTPSAAGPPPTVASWWPQLREPSADCRTPQVASTNNLDQRQRIVVAPTSPTARFPRSKSVEHCSVNEDALLPRANASPRKGRVEVPGLSAQCLTGRHFPRRNTVSGNTADRVGQQHMLRQKELVIPPRVTPSTLCREDAGSQHDARFALVSPSFTPVQTVGPPLSAEAASQIQRVKAIPSPSWTPATTPQCRSPYRAVCDSGVGALPGATSHQCASSLEVTMTRNSARQPNVRCGRGSSVHPHRAAKPVSVTLGSGQAVLGSTLAEPQ